MLKRIATRWYLCANSPKQVNLLASVRNSAIFGQVFLLKGDFGMQPKPSSPPQNAQRDELEQILKDHAIQSAALNRQLAMLLNGSVVGNIAFQFSNVRVMPQRFAMVSQAISTGKIRVYVSPAILNSKTVGGAVAVYASEMNLMFFESSGVLRTPAGQGVAVHEAVHAANDYVKHSGSTIQEEAASAIAEAWYLLEVQSWGNPRYSPHSAIRTIAEDLRKQAKTTSGMPTASSDQIMTATRIMSFEGYVDRTFTHDGIK